jgi:hypothetical protein
VTVTTEDIGDGVSNITISSLQPNNNYSVNVLAHTKSGKGEPIEKNITTYAPGTTYFILTLRYVINVCVILIYLPFYCFMLLAVD